MRAYYLRLLCALVLLKVASGLMKDAEKLLTSNMATQVVEAEVVAVEFASTNGKLDPTDMEVEESLDGPTDEDMAAAALGTDEAVSDEAVSDNG